MEECEEEFRLRGPSRFGNAERVDLGSDLLVRWGEQRYVLDAKRTRKKRGGEKRN